MITNELLPLDGVDIDYKNQDNARSIVNLVPSWLSEKIKVIPDEILAMSENELIEKGKITSTERRLKTAWWFEFTKSLHRQLLMKVNEAVTGVMPLDHFKKNFCTNSYKLAYLITPPVNYKHEMVDLLQVGMIQMREMLMMDNYDSKGDVNTRLLEVKFKIVKDIIDRVHGQVIQRVEMKSQNINMNVNRNEVEESAQSIDEQIKNLENMLNAPNGVVIDVEEKVKIPEIDRETVFGQGYDAREEGVSEVRFNSMGGTEDSGD